MHLKGLDPKENRTIPPLWYDRVFRLKSDFPDLDIVINGGLESLKAVKTVLEQEPKLDGAMVGRLAMNNPWVFAGADSFLFGQPDSDITREELILTYADYA